MDMLWECPLCKARNAVGSKRCALCRNPYTGSEKVSPKIQELILPEWEEDSKVFDDLNARIEKASATISKESLPPKGAIRLVVPNNPLGWLMVTIVVLALAMTLAVLKTIF
jgi:hypothetical protein